MAQQSHTNAPNMVQTLDFQRLLTPSTAVCVLMTPKKDNKVPLQNLNLATDSETRS